MLKRTSTSLPELGVSVKASAFAGAGGAGEWHAMLRVEPRGEAFAGQLRRLYEAEDRLASMPGFEGARYVFKRYFVTDSANQAPLMRRETGVSLSVIQQPPLDGGKVACWAYLTACEPSGEGGGETEVRHNGYRHIWSSGLTCPEGSSEEQTASLLTLYEESLARRGATMEGNCVRTWFFVRDIDTQYSGMVKARREHFERHGMTTRTHYIASTGIGGVPSERKALVQMGCYALLGHEAGQVRYLKAPSHLNATSDYGVTFERGTAVEYGDRKHVIISGTASINNRGEVVHEGDIEGQTRRMWDNVEALLREGGATYDDVAQMVVYLRDLADTETVSRLFEERFPDVPLVITLAPVCRPTWLIEIECVAITDHANKAYRAF